MTESPTQPPAHPSPARSAAPNWPPPTAPATTAVLTAPRPPVPAPLPPTRWQLVWPGPWADAAPVTLLAAAAVVAGAAASVLRIGVASIVVPVIGVLVLGVGLGARQRRPSATHVVSALGSLALLAVAGVRAADWLVTLCVLAALAVLPVVVAPARTWTGLFAGTQAGWLVLPRTVRWVARALHGRRTGVSSGRLAVVGAVTAVLVLVFGALFASADAAYAQLLGALVPFDDPASAVGRTFVFVGTLAVTLSCAALATHPPSLDRLAPDAPPPRQRWEWAVPLLALDAVFLSFVVVQLSVLFGGSGHVERTAGLTYAEYARSGFWQLLLVTALTLVVLAVAVRYAPRGDRRDRQLLRGLLGGLCVLTLVVVVSALYRMSLYENEFGYTRLRVLVTATEVWLGAIVVLLLVAGVQLSGRWLPRAALTLTVVALLAVAAINPDAVVARGNVDRYDKSGRIDVDYLAGLSADAVPELQRLPATARSCALVAIADRLAQGEWWYELNLGRSVARSSLAGRPPGPCPRSSAGSLP